MTWEVSLVGRVAGGRERRDALDMIAIVETTVSRVSHILKRHPP